MTDRELLELAGKAIGQEVYWLGDDAPAIAGRYWNPLTDDGDALRLAVDCDMTVCADGLAMVSACYGYGHNQVMVTQFVCECGNDKSAATRRAITRAAAAIGKDMQ